MRKILINALALLAAGAGIARAQTLVVEPTTSLAWWQINPHLGHLWASTCPQDPSWQPGESRGSDSKVDKKTRKEVSIVNDDDPRVPVYPRLEVTQGICSEAVSGSITARDTVRWTGVKGVVNVKTEHLYNGMEMRDDFARRAIYSTSEYPAVRFTIDSLANVRPGQRRSDTLNADAIGTFEFRGVRTAFRVPLKAWPDGGGLRVQGTFSFPASELIDVYKVSRFSLGLGLATHIWKTVHMGFDLIMVPQGGNRSS